MTIKNTTLFLLLFFVGQFIFAQDSSYVIEAQRINDNQITVDGTLDEPVWKTAGVATNFTEVEPYNGQKDKNQTFVRLLYTNNALYVGFEMHDSAPDSINKHLVARDNFGQADHCGVLIDPFGDAISGMVFYVSSVGVQIDGKQNMNNDDFTWDAVWQVATQFTEKGWNAEYKIPYSAIRFPNNPKHNWTINFFRNLQRHKKNSSWAPIPTNNPNILQRNGLVTNVHNIKPPLRLSFLPYVSGYLIHDGQTNTFSESVRGGLDLKYGINESFTLDMMLIPDFGQVQSDDVVLNLSPFETYYTEKRAFFTEGTELYNSANIFYSRRIGGTPDKFSEVYNQLNENEQIIKNPSELQLLNATKVTGKTSEGLSVGVLNAISAKTFAEIQDTISGNKRNVQTQQNTNYNVAVIEQSFKNNSFFTLINTNLMQADTNYMANVSAYDSRIVLKNSTHEFRSTSAFSYKNNGQQISDGFTTSNTFSKIKGNFLYQLNNYIESDTYDPNDMGYLQQNNEIVSQAQLSYNIYNPFWKMLYLYTDIDFTHAYLYNPSKYKYIEFDVNIFSTLKNHLSTGIELEYRPVRGYDYDEPRIDGRFYRRPTWFVGSWFFSSDYRKKIALDGRLGFYTTNVNQWNGLWLRLSPLWRMSNHWLLRFTLNAEQDKSERGFFDYLPDQQSVYFARRNRQSVTTSIDLDYIITNKMSINIRGRHYWTKVNYLDYYLLNVSGELNPAAYNATNDGINFNSFNLDWVYNWEFAPGSFFSFVWKTSILHENQNVNLNYFSNLETFSEQSGQNSFSLKLIYYVDFARFAK